MANRTYEKSVDAQGTANDMFGYCISALNAIDASLESKDINFGIILASRGSRMNQGFTGKLAMDIKISVMPNGRNQTTVTVACTQKMGFLDVKEQTKLVERYLQALDFLVRRAMAAQ